jgi:hypothetical protein
MNNIEIKKVVIRITQSGSNNALYAKEEPGHRSSSNIYVTTDHREAYDVQEHTAAQIIRMLNTVSNNPEHIRDTVELCEMTISVKEKLVDTHEGPFLEERRRAAFGKLTKDDIKALGVEGLAIYNKLKFHQVEDQQ